VLNRFVDHGLVLQEDAGRARVYRLNRDHVAAESISQLVELRPRLLRRLRDTFEDWHRAPFHASVFGSAARGDGDVNSDVDIFLVRPADVREDDEEWQKQVVALADQVFGWTGNHAGIAEIGEDALERLRKERPEIVESIRADAVDISGFPARSLLRRI
jgi:predicted nucleotidyltransferase